MSWTLEVEVGWFAFFFQSRLPLCSSPLLSRSLRKKPIIIFKEEPNKPAINGLAHGPCKTQTHQHQCSYISLCRHSFVFYGHRARSVLAPGVVGTLDSLRLERPTGKCSSLPILNFCSFAGRLRRIDRTRHAHVIRERQEKEREMGGGAKDIESEKEEESLFITQVLFGICLMTCVFVNPNLIFYGRILDLGMAFSPRGGCCSALPNFPPQARNIPSLPRSSEGLI